MSQKISIHLKTSTDEIDHLIIKSLSMTTYDIAEVIYFLYKDQFVYSGHNNWYQFQGHKWINLEEVTPLRELISNEVVKLYIKYSSQYLEQSSLSDINDERKRYFKQSKTLSDISFKLRDITFKNKVMGECADKFNDSTFENRLDQNPDLICFTNGVYDLRQGQLRAGRPEDYLTQSLEYPYQSYQPECELLTEVRTFMSQLFPDNEVQKYVYLLLASFIEGRNPHEKFHIWTGCGGNGKSKLTELFENSFGPYCSKVPSTLFTQESRGLSNAASPELACLKTKRVVTAQEPDDSKHERPTINTGVIKDLTGNDKVTCRPLYGEQFEYRPQFKVILSCNKLPDLSADDDGIWRRISVLPFTSRFVDDPIRPNEFKKDDYLNQKFGRWRPAFTFLILEAYKEYLTVGLIEPPQIKEATAEYRKNVDDIQSFIKDKIIFEKDSYVSLKEIWEAFKSSEYYTKKLPMKQFKSDLEHKLGITCEARKKIKGIDYRSIFMGIKIETGEEKMDCQL